MHGWSQAQKHISKVKLLGYFSWLTLIISDFSVESMLMFDPNLVSANVLKPKSLDSTLCPDNLWIFILKREAKSYAYNSVNEKNASSVESL